MTDHAFAVGGVAPKPWPTVAVPSRERIWIGIALGATILLQIYLVFTKSINWDEFFYFNHIQELRDGTLTRPLQAFHTRYLGWLFDLPGTPLDQLLYGRLFMLACEAAAALALFGIARRFAGPTTAALCALTYVTAGYVFLHGFAFRTDPQATAALMSALWMFSGRRLSWGRMFAVAMLLALAGMITVKSIFYAPAFLGIAWLRFSQSEDRRQFVLRCAAIVALAGLCFASLFFWHGSSLPVPPVQAGGGSLNSAWETVFSAGLLPQAEHLLRQVRLAPHLFVMLAASPFLWRRHFASRPQLVAMAGLLLPLATILFYRNSYPYFFVFILPPAMVTAIPAIELVAKRLGPALFSLALVLLAATLALSEPKSILPTQRSVVSGVQQIFPEPVTYVDFSGFVGNYPRALAFMPSGWGLQRYRLAEVPRLVEAMSRQPIPLLIVNHAVIYSAVSGDPHDEMLLPQDAAALRANYVPHWGPVWVAGKRLAPGPVAQTIDIAVPGIYTLERAALAVDGRRIEIGETFFLARGTHRVEPNAAREAVLRWGDHLPVPKQAAPDQPYFSNY